MKRQIIKIDDAKCNGCGLCASACAEGAIQIVEGKARLVSEIFCDGLGACLGECPLGAISVEEREADAYDERKTMENLLAHGTEVVKLHLEHLKDHGQQKLFEEGMSVLKEKGIEIPGLKKAAMASPCGCPGMAGLQIATAPTASSPSIPSRPVFPNAKERNWPIQLHLINPASEAFDGADLVIAADCTAFSLSDFYREYTQGKALIVFCPKLDRSNEIYVEKLASIFSMHDIHSITILRMLVPCCGGTSMVVQNALERSGKNFPLKELIVNFDGTIQ